jgi:hypothetical protein
MQMFSINAASLLLERDRRTVTKAMHGVAADGKERGQPRWKMSTIVAALDKHSGGPVQGCGRLCEIADELQRLDGELDTTIATIKSLPDMDSKQPHSRAAMQMVQRIDALYTEGNELKSKIEPGSPWPYVTPQIVGTLFRMVLAAVYGPKVESTANGCLPTIRSSNLSWDNPWHAPRKRCPMRTAPVIGRFTSKK